MTYRVYPRTCLRLTLLAQPKSRADPSQWLCSFVHHTPPNGGYQLCVMRSEAQLSASGDRSVSARAARATSACTTLDFPEPTLVEDRTRRRCRPLTFSCVAEHRPTTVLRAQARVRVHGGCSMQNVTRDHPRCRPMTTSGHLRLRVYLPGQVGEGCTAKSAALSNIRSKIDRNTRVFRKIPGGTVRSSSSPPTGSSSGQMIRAEWRQRSGRSAAAMVKRVNGDRPWVPTQARWSHRAGVRRGH